MIKDNIKKEIEQLKNQTGQEIVIFGSPSAAHALMKDNLIDDYWIFVNPVLMGNGIPLFNNIQERISLKLKETHAFQSGVVCLHYERV